MSKYRIEKCPNNRAGCMDTLCKTNGIKILKGEIRFGVWVETSDFSSFRYKHWGCVSGFQLQNIRKDLQDGETIPADGQYNWDFLDGLSELPPDMMIKVKTAIMEGKIADEDFKGDPEYNHLGAKGIRGRAKKEKPTVEAEGDDPAGPSETPKKPDAKKRGRAKKEVLDDDDDHQEEIKPAKKRAKKAKKEEDSDHEAIPPPVKKTKGNKAKKGEVESDDEAIAPPVKNAKGKRVTKKEKLEEGHDMKIERNDEASTDVKPAKSVKKAKRKTVAKKEPEELDVVKKEENEEAMADIKPAKKSRAKKVAPKAEPEESFKQENGQDKEVKPTKKSRSKAAVTKGSKLRGDDVKMEDIEPFNMENAQPAEESNANMKNSVETRPIEKALEIGEETKTKVAVKKTSRKDMKVLDPATAVSSRPRRTKST